MSIPWIILKSNCFSSKVSSKILNFFLVNIFCITNNLSCGIILIRFWAQKPRRWRRSWRKNKYTYIYALSIVYRKELFVCDLWTLKIWTLNSRKIINEEILSISFLLILFNFLPWNLLCGCFYITRTRFSNTNQSGRTSTQNTPATMMLETTMAVTKTWKKLNFIITDIFPSHRDFSKVHFWPSCSLPRLLSAPLHRAWWFFYDTKHIKERQSARDNSLALHSYAWVWVLLTVKNYIKVNKSKQ